MKKLILIPFLCMCMYSGISAREIVIDFDVPPFADGEGGEMNAHIHEVRNPDNVIAYLRDRIQQYENMLAQPNLDERNLNVHIARAGIPALRALLVQEQENEKAEGEEKIMQAVREQPYPRSSKREYKKRIY